RPRSPIACARRAPAEPMTAGPRAAARSWLPCGPGLRPGMGLPRMGSEITQLLERASTGEPAQLSEVFERLYPQLRQIAAARLHPGERTLTPTVLVHELYL